MFLDKAIFYCLAWAAFWLPFIAVPAGVFCKTFTDIGLELALLLWFVKVVRFRRTGFKKIGHHIDTALFFLAAVSLCSVPFSPIKIWSFGDFLGILVGIFSVYLIMSVLKEKKHYTIMWTCLLTGICLVSVLGLLQLPLFALTSTLAPQNISPLLRPFLFLTQTGNSNHTRICSTFIEYSGVNVYSGYLVIMLMLLIPSLIFYFKKMSGPLKALSLTGFLLLTSNLVLTKGRAAYIALFLALYCLALLFKAQRKALISVLLAGTLAAIIFVAPVRNAILDIFSPTSSSNKERLELYEPAFRQMAQRPLTGWGDGHAGRKIILDQRTQDWKPFDVNEYFDPRFKNITTFGEKQAYYAAHGIIAINRPHNIFLTTTVEMGSLGLLALIYFFYALIAALVRRFQKSGMTEAGIQALTLAGAFMSIAAYGMLHDSLNARPYAMLFWILIGMTGATLNNMSSAKSGTRRAALRQAQGKVRGKKPFGKLRVKQEARTKKKKTH